MASPQSSLSSADSDIEAPPPRPPSTGTKRAASIAFSDQSPVSSHPPRRRPPPPQPSTSSNINNHHNHHAVDDEEHHHHIHQHATSLSDISSDTSGSVPGSPRDHHNDDGEFAEQVTVCRWAGCNEDLGNMDDLVKHIHDDHIGSRKAKYACEWDDCSRKGMTHASGYALRAHMRSHTREKPFYCSLPECDRSFTRSDALAKHMRTVHETEALRPSDPIPKSHPNHPQNIANSAYVDALFRRQSKAMGGSANGDGFRVLNLAANIPSSSTNNNTPSKNGLGAASYRNESDSEMENGGVPVRRSVGGKTLENLAIASAAAEAAAKKPPVKSYYQPTDPFSPEDETHRPPKELYKYLKQKLKWVQETQDTLQSELDGYVKRRREAWVKKELLLEKMLEMELGDEARLVSIYTQEKKKTDTERMNEAMDREDGVEEEEDAELTALKAKVAGVKEEENGARMVDEDIDVDGEEEEAEEVEVEDEYATEEE
ncbi:hypothetical protein DFH27DRAFT_540868 [Peziza echinospora]|nr:hypothetical protein DFH27DRAFT_540868 [Peziza echinospora]